MRTVGDFELIELCVTDSRRRRCCGPCGQTPVRPRHRGVRLVVEAVSHSKLHGEDLRTSGDGRKLLHRAPPRSSGSTHVVPRRVVIHRVFPRCVACVTIPQPSERHRRQKSCDSGRGCGCGQLCGRDRRADAAGRAAGRVRGLHRRGGSGLRSPGAGTGGSPPRRRNARATPLNDASITWWPFFPVTLRMCNVTRAPSTNPFQNSSASCGSKVPIHSETGSTS